MDERSFTQQAKKIKKRIPISTATKALITTSAGNTRRNKTDAVHSHCIHNEQVGPGQTVGWANLSQLLDENGDRGFTLYQLSLQEDSQGAELKEKSPYHPVDWVGPLLLKSLSAEHSARWKCPSLAMSDLSQMEGRRTFMPCWIREALGCR